MRPPSSCVYVRRAGELKTRAAAGRGARNRPWRRSTGGAGRCRGGEGFAGDPCPCLRVLPRSSLPLGLPILLDQGNRTRASVGKKSGGAFLRRTMLLMKVDSIGYSRHSDMPCTAAQGHQSNLGAIARTLHSTVGPVVRHSFVHNHRPTLELNKQSPPNRRKLIHRNHHTREPCTHNRQPELPRETGSTRGRWDKDSSSRCSSHRKT